MPFMLAFDNSASPAWEGGGGDFKFCIRSTLQRGKKERKKVVAEESGSMALPQKKKIS